MAMKEQLKKHVLYVPSFLPSVAFRRRSRSLSFLRAVVMQAS